MERSEPHEKGGPGLELRGVDEGAVNVGEGLERLGRSGRFARDLSLGVETRRDGGARVLDGSERIAVGARGVATEVALLEPARDLIPGSGEPRGPVAIDGFDQTADTRLRVMDEARCSCARGGSVAEPRLAGSRDERFGLFEKARIGGGGGACPQRSEACCARASKPGLASPAMACITRSRSALASASANSSAAV